MMDAELCVCVCVFVCVCVWCIQFDASQDNQKNNMTIIKPSLPVERIILFG